MTTLMGKEDTVSRLVARAQQGDRAAFEELVSRYEARLRGQIEARMGSAVRAKLEVADVLQETLSCALQSIDKLSWQGEECFYSWLGSIAEHIISNAARKKSWTPLELKRDPTNHDTRASKHLRRDERFERLEKALHHLTPDHREALRLSRLDGLKVEEIAERMGRSPNAVYKLVARALVELKRSFGDTESFHLPPRRFDLQEGEHDD